MDFSGIPIPTIKGEFGYKREDINSNSTNIPENSAKIITRILDRERLLVKCDGNGSFICDKLQNRTDALKEYADLLEKKHITKREYNKAKKELGF